MAPGRTSCTLKAWNDALFLRYVCERAERHGYKLHEEMFTSILIFKQPLYVCIVLV